MSVLFPLKLNVEHNKVLKGSSRTLIDRILMGRNITTISSLATEAREKSRPSQIEGSKLKPLLLCKT